MSKTIVVIGATGNQGGSVVETLLQDKTWKIRGTTTRTDSPKAQALKAKGVEIVKVDVEDPSSLETVFQGAHSIFAVTNWDWAVIYGPANPKRLRPGQTLHQLAYEDELRQAKNMIDAAAKTASLERFIFSGLSDASKWSNGKYTGVYHFDSKAHAIEYGKKTYPDLWAKTSVIQLGSYLSNWLNTPTLMPVKTISPQTNKPLYTFTLLAPPPPTKFPHVAPEEDTGPLVQHLLSSPLPDDRPLLAFRSLSPLSEFATTWGRVMNVDVQVNHVPLHNPTSNEEGNGNEFMTGLVEMMRYFQEFGYDGGDPDVVHPGDLENPPSLPSMADWIKKQDWSKFLDQTPQ